MKQLHAALTDLANNFAQQLLGVVREASVADLRDAFGRADTPATSGRIVALLQTRRAGMRATEIRTALGMSQTVLAALVAEGLRAKTLVKTGVRRGTMYFAR